MPAPSQTHDHSKTNADGKKPALHKANSKELASGNPAHGPAKGQKKQPKTSSRRSDD